MRFDTQSSASTAKSFRGLTCGPQLIHLFQDFEKTLFRKKTLYFFERVYLLFKE